MTVQADIMIIIFRGSLQAASNVKGCERSYDLSTLLWF